VEVVLPLKEPQNIKFSFRKSERLCSQRIISGLFQPGFFVSSTPFRFNVLFTDLPVQGVQAQVVFVVGKKRFKRAVDRNKIKRWMRELYRLNKHHIFEALQSVNKTAALALFYTGGELPSYATLELEFAKAIKKLIHEIGSK
jgi:ribonuclease P protein component